MFSLRKLSIKHRLILHTMGISIGALLLAGLSLALFEQVSLRRSLEREVVVVADIIDDGVAANLAAHQIAAVEQTLKTLSPNRHVVAAGVYDHAGQLVAEYRRSGDRDLFEFPRDRRAGQRYVPDRLDTFHDVVFRGVRIGAIYLSADLGALHERAWFQLQVIAGLLVVGSLVALVLTLRFQRIVSEPITDLVRTVAAVEAGGDYAIRAHRHGSDELGRLAEGFNRMLAQIQAHDALLQQANNELELRVAHRTTELSKANGELRLLEAAMHASANAIFITDAQGLIQWTNAAFTALTGYTTAEVVGQNPRVLKSGKHDGGFYQQMWTTITAGRAWRGEIVNCRKDGECYDEEMTITPVSDPQGGALHFIAVKQDITARKRSDMTHAALLRISEAAHESGDLPSLYRRIHEIVGALLPAQNFYVALHDPTTDLLSFPYFVDEVDPVPAPRLPGNGLTGHVLRTGRPLLLTAGMIMTMARSGEISLIGTPPQDWLGVPLISGQRSIGVLAVQIYSGPVRLTGRDLELLLYVSQHIATAIERKRAETVLDQAQKELINVSRQAGMAEVATGVLHNIGNVLNSVNVSASLVTDQLRESKAANLPKIAAMLEEHAGDLAEFLTDDPKGRKIPAYLAALAAQIAAERQVTIGELDHLRKNIDHIKEVVAMQQSYARASGVNESLPLADLIEDALRMNADSCARHHVQIGRDFQALPVVTTDKHKLMQILVNLVRNAKHACEDAGGTDKKITLRTTADAHSVTIAVADNGVGIVPENFTRIFSHGFTTRKNGHGFGLHSGAIAAKELGGSLRVESAGPGQGATFVLTLPLVPMAGTA